MRSITAGLLELKSASVAQNDNKIHIFAH